MVTIHNTIFHNCSSQSNAGGACLIIEKGKTINPLNFNNDEVPEMGIQHCCFQNFHEQPSLYSITVFATSIQSRIN